MNINFNFSTSCSYGGRLNPPLTYFDKYFSEILSKSDIKSSIEEVEIMFSYPPYILPEGFKETQGRFWDWYNRLPYIRFSKKRSMISITITFPEISEYLQKKDFLQSNTSYVKYVKQEIKSEYLNKTTNDILQIILVKMGEIANIINSKIKKLEVFEIEKFISTIKYIEDNISLNDWEQIEAKFKQIERDKRLQRNLQNRQNRNNQNIAGNRLIYDIRFMYRFENIGLKYFEPYENLFCDEILEKLRAKKFRCPNYTHLYIMVSETYENSLYQAVRAADWFVYGLATLNNPLEYQSKSEIEKKAIVFNLIKQGLLDIANIDKLDANILNEVLNEVESKHFPKLEMVKIPQFIS